jgi:hypothetical protein
MPAPITSTSTSVLCHIAQSNGSIPAGYIPIGIPIGIVLLGHEASDARQYGDVSADPRRRRPRGDVVHYGHWE